MTRLEVTGPVIEKTCLDRRVTVRRTSVSTKLPVMPGRTGARKGRRHASPGTPRKRLGLVDADVFDQLEELSGERGISRDAFTTLVLRAGLHAFTVQHGAQESLMTT